MAATNRVDPFAEFGGIALDEQDGADPFENFGGRVIEQDAAADPFAPFDGVADEEPGAVKGLINTARRSFKQLGQTGDVASILMSKASSEGRGRDMEYQQAVLDSIDASKLPDWAKNWWRRAAEAQLQRSQNDQEQARENIQQNIGEIAERQKAISAIPESEDVRRYNQAEGWKALLEIAKNPVELPANIATRGAITSLPGMVLGAGGTAAGGPIAGAAGVGAGSFAVEYIGAITDSLAKRGVDLSDPEALQQTLLDPAFLQEARERGVKRGIPIAAFDAISAGIAGRFLGPAKEAGKKLAPAALKEAGTQAALGGGGEIAGSLAAGDAVDPKAVIEEIIGEVVPGTREVAQNVWQDRRSAAKSEVKSGPDAPAEQLDATTQANLEQALRERRAPKVDTTPPADSPERADSLEAILRTITERNAAQAQAQEDETRAREQRRAQIESRQENLQNTLDMARGVIADPEASFGHVQGALRSLENFADDNSLRIDQGRREELLQSIARLRPRFETLQRANEQRSHEATNQARIEKEREQAAQKERVKQERAAIKKQAREGIGASGVFEYSTAPMNVLEERAETGDQQAINEIARREEETAVEAAGDVRDDLLTVLQRMKLPHPDNETTLRGELRERYEEWTNFGQRQALFSRDQTAGLDAIAEALRADYGFTQMQTPSDVIDGLDRVLRGERIMPKEGIEFAEVNPANRPAPPAAKIKESDDPIKSWLARGLQREEDESKGRYILETLEEEGISPSTVIREFFANTYHQLPDQVRQRFNRYMERQTGMGPSTGETWADVYTPETFGADSMEYLEGTERGLIALMAQANYSSALRGEKIMPQRTEEFAAARKGENFLRMTPELAGKEVALIQVPATNRTRQNAKKIVETLPPTRNEATGMDVSIPATALTHSAQSGAAVNAIEQWPELIANAVPLVDEPHTGRDGARVHRMLAAVERNGVKQAAKLTIISKGGHASLYDVAIEPWPPAAESRKEPPAGDQPDSLKVRRTADGSDVRLPLPANRITIGSLFPQVKRDEIVDFARPKNLPVQPISERDRKRAWRALRRAFPKLAREVDLEITRTDEELREAFTRRGIAVNPQRLRRIDAAVIPAELQERAEAARAKKDSIVYAWKSWTSFRRGGARTAHEVAHIFWYALPADTRALLREQHRREVTTKTGPLYDADGKLTTDIAGVEVIDGREGDSWYGTREWFAERMAAMNTSWAEGRLQRGSSIVGQAELLLRDAWEQLMEIIRQVFTADVNGRNQDPESAFWQEEFRRFMMAGAMASERTGSTATAYAQAKRAEFATQGVFDLGVPVGYALPAAIRNLVPRWQEHQLDFKRPIDKALYYAGGEGNTEVRDTITADLQEQTGLSYGQVRTLARQLRERMRPHVSGAPGVARVPIPPLMTGAVRSLTGVMYAEVDTSTGKPETPHNHERGRPDLRDGYQARVSDQRKADRKGETQRRLAAFNEKLARGADHRDQAARLLKVREKLLAEGPRRGTPYPQPWENQHWSGSSFPFEYYGEKIPARVSARGDSEYPATNRVSDRERSFTESRSQFLNRVDDSTGLRNENDLQLLRDAIDEFDRGGRFEWPPALRDRKLHRRAEFAERGESAEDSRRALENAKEAAQKVEDTARDRFEELDEKLRTIAQKLEDLRDSQDPDVESDGRELTRQKREAEQQRNAAYADFVAARDRTQLWADRLRLHIMPTPQRAAEAFGNVEQTKKRIDELEQELRQVQKQDSLASDIRTQWIEKELARLRAGVQAADPEQASIAEYQRLQGVASELANNGHTFALREIREQLAGLRERMDEDWDYPRIVDLGRSGCFSWFGFRSQPARDSRLKNAGGGGCRRPRSTRRSLGEPGRGRRSDGGRCVRF